ncbi:MAG: hypothetical protein ACPGO3_06205 [Magnetospiraceae bacterium]
MAHFIVEFSANLETVLDLNGLCDCLRAAGAATEILPTAGIRVRAIRCDYYAIADGDLPDAGFIDISIRLRGGRGLEDRKRATQDIYAAAEAFLEPYFAQRPFALSLEMRDIDPELSPKRSSYRDFMKKDN